MPIDENGEWYEEEEDSELPERSEYAPPGADDYSDYRQEEPSYENQQQHVQQAFDNYYGPVAQQQQPQQAPPRIFNRDAAGGYTEQQDAPVSPGDFQAFQQGGNEGLLDQPYQSRQDFFQRQRQIQQAERERQMPPEVRLAQTLAQLGAATPSPAENLQTARLQNAAAAVQAHVANGTITPQAGQQANALIQQQLGPLMVRRSEIPMYQARARYQAMQLQNAQRAAVMQQDAAFRARTAQQRLHSVTLPDGQQVQFIEDARGGLTPVRDLMGEQAGREEARQATEQRRAEATTRSEQRRWDSAYDAEVRAMRTEAASFERARAAGRNPTAPTWFNRHSSSGIATGASQQTIENEARQRVQRRLGARPSLDQQSGQQPSQSSSGVSPESRAAAISRLNRTLGITSAAPAAPAPQAPPASPAAQPQRVSDFNPRADFSGGL